MPITIPSSATDIPDPPKEPVNGPQPSQSEETHTPLDPFDPASLRIDPQDAAGNFSVVRMYTTLKVQKPIKSEFCRVHPEASFQLVTAILEDKVNGESYIVAPRLRAQLPEFLCLTNLALAVTRHGNPFLWPAKIPDPNGRANVWHTSMLDAQKMAINDWVQVKSDMGAGMYLVSIATGNLPDPQWPELTFHECLKLAFQNRFIDSMDHPYILELTGRA